ncbi:N-acetyl-alpha-D-glucosaminyl L-malate synthase [Bienertia sinuspersici]
MEDTYNDEDMLGNVVRPSTLRTLKPTLSGRSTPRSSPTFRRFPSSRTPRRDGRSAWAKFQWFRSDRLVYWLLLITLWTYGGFYIQSRWAHRDNSENEVGFGRNSRNEYVESRLDQRRELKSDDTSFDMKNRSSHSDVVVNGSKLNNSMNSFLAERADVSLPPRVRPPRTVTAKKRSRNGRRGSQSKRRGKIMFLVKSKNAEVLEEEIPMTNSSYGWLVGPFGSIEDRILEWSPEKRTGTCNRNELFARLVWSRNFVLIIHELSMTGAPLSMLELATELMSCGATVHAVVLSRRGGLMTELTKRRIKVIDDKAEHSFKAAMKADLVIAGSAVCAQWIERYLAYFNAGSNQIAWWIMENRREYFDRSKGMLNRVKMLAFLSELQSKQWLDWSKEENTTLTTQTALIPLSVNDELAFVAGIPSSLNTPLSNPEKMSQRRQMLRNAVRQEMGLTDNDMLVISLGSINAAKGQLLLVESAYLAIEGEPFQSKVSSNISHETEKKTSKIARKFHLRGVTLKQNSSRSLLQNSMSDGLSVNHSNPTSSDIVQSTPRVDSSHEVSEQKLKILIGSVGSKSNKVMYVKEILDFISGHSNLSESILWSPTTTRVASLYSAADVYVTNSQGLGETFGRVTIEAMAYGLPVLGTDAGGTKEIIEQNVTGLLHPVGHSGTKLLAENLRYLLKNPSLRQQMGLKGRERVEKMYLKHHMYKSFFEVLFKCMKVK